MPTQLSKEQEEELTEWIDSFELSRSAKRIGRDFSDAVLLAEILKSLFPKAVDLHNYPPRNSAVTKIDNWITLNRKVLRKINVNLEQSIIMKLAQADVPTIGSVLYDVMQKSQLVLTTKASNMSNDSTDSQQCKIEVDLLSEANKKIKISQRSRTFNAREIGSTLADIMMINIENRIGDQIEITSQKMILYTLYEKLELMLNEKNQIITILSQKNEHLENLLKLKNQRIEDLEMQLKKKKIVQEMSTVIEHEPNLIIKKD